MKPHHMECIGRKYAREFCCAKLYHQGVQWRGHPITKLPTDLWIYQEIIWETKPQIIIECGTGRAGGTIFFSDMLRAVQPTGSSLVVSIDHLTRHNYPRVYQQPGEGFHAIHFIDAGSTKRATADKAWDSITSLQPALLPMNPKIMLSLDSKHTADHVGAELALWQRFVSLGCYIVVEDTIVDEGLGIHPQLMPGPLVAVEKFLQAHPQFERRRWCEKFGATTNRGGYLKRVHPEPGHAIPSQR